MQKLRYWLVVGLLCVQAVCQAAPKGTLLYVPMDTRPVCKNYSVATLQAAGWEVELPPDEYLAAGNRSGKPEALAAWLKAKGPTASAMVVSADALLYGGLLDSRTHHLTEEQLKPRLQNLLNLKTQSGNANVYTFITVMRSPRMSSAPAEPAYYDKLGPELFRRGVLLDKQELGLSKRSEQKELASLEQKLPSAVTQDLDGRRRTNLELTKALLTGVNVGAFDYLLIGKDDSATFSQAHKDARALSTQVAQLPKGKIRFFSGADELGLVLLARAVNNLTYTTPFVHPFYGDGSGAQFVPGFEDGTIGKSVREHIFAAGAYPVPTDKRADLFLGVFTPEDGVVRESNDPPNNGVITGQQRRFTAQVKQLLQQHQPVAVADVAYGNGSDRALVAELFKEQVAWDVAAYGGWNTASNSMGFALAQGLLAAGTPAAQRKDLLAVRYLEDCFYQSLVRDQVYRNLIWAQNLPNQGMKEPQLSLVQEAITTRMLKEAQPLLGALPSHYRYTLPWQRMFEVEVQKL